MLLHLPLQAVEPSTPQQENAEVPSVFEGRIEPSTGGLLASRVIARSALVLFVAHVLHPLDHFAVERFLNGNVRHGGCRRSAVPMLLVRRKPDHIARPDFFDRSAPTLRPSEAGRDDQRLTKWMCMPRSACTRLERDVCTTHTCRLWSFKQRINPHGPGKPVS